MFGENQRSFKNARWRNVVAAAVLSSLAVSVSAQETQASDGGEYVDRLKACQLLRDDSERLACFDRAVGAIVAGNDAGEVRIIDQDDIRDTRRQLFGFSVPEVGVLKRDEKEDKEASELLDTAIVSVSYLSRKKLRFTTTEGAVWEISNAPRWLRTVEAGDSVTFKKASLGYYFARIDGQLGVKSKRTE